LNDNKWKLQDALIDHGKKSDADKVVKRSEAILDSILDKPGLDAFGQKQPKSTFTTKEMMTKASQKFADEKAAKDNLSKVAASSTAGGHLGDGDSLKNYIAGKVKGQDLVLKQEHLDKIKFLNPQGIQDGKFYVPAIGVPTDPKYVQFIDNLKKTLPAGTDIKKIVVPKNAANNPDVMFSKGKIVPATSVTGTKKVATEPYPEYTKATPTPKPSNAYMSPKVVQYKDGGFKKEDKATYKGQTLSHDDLEDKNHPAWIAANKSLSSTERSAIVSWKGSAEEMRKTITSNPPPPPNSPKEKAFLQALEKMPKFEGTVYRGVGSSYGKKIFEQVMQAGVGGNWHDTAPHCTSRNSYTATSFSGSAGLILEIKTKSGRSIQKVGGHNDEQEVVGLPNTQYKIVSIKKDHELKQFSGTGYVSSGTYSVAHHVTLEEI
jgi:hypothetical protein